MYFGVIGYSGKWIWIHLFDLTLEVGSISNVPYFSSKEKGICSQHIYRIWQIDNSDKHILETLETEHNHVHHPPYDDVIKWKHFLRYWPFVRGIHRSSVNSPHKWRGALIFFICVWINGWVNNPEAGDLRRYRVHYDVIVMTSRQHVSLIRQMNTDKIKYVTWNEYAKCTEQKTPVTWTVQCLKNRRCYWWLPLNCHNAPWGYNPHIMTITLTE